MDKEGKSWLEKEYAAAVREHLLHVEEEYNENMDFIESIGEAERVLQSIETTKYEKIQQGDNTREITKFLSESRMHFDDMVNKCIEDETFVFDFGKWAHDIERDLRAQDPFGISKASICGAELLDDGTWTAPDTTVVSHGGQTVKSFVQILQANGDLRTLKTVGTPEENSTFFWASSLAWAFTVVGMVVVLGLLSKDFYNARTKLAIQLDRQVFPHMPYPAVTICNNKPRVPLFFDFPTQKYPGSPLFGLSSISLRNSTTGLMEIVKYPGTVPHESSRIEEVVSGPIPDSCLRVKKEMSINADQEAQFTLGDVFNVSKIKQMKQREHMHTSTECYWCLRVGFEPKIPAQFDGSGGKAATAPSFKLNFFRSTFTEGCSTMSGFRNRAVRSLMGNELRIHSEALIDRKILDFGGFPPGNPQYDALVTVEHGFYHEVLGGGVLGRGDYVASMMFACNVYFYSGYFYPTRGKPDIRYRFEYENRSWSQTGRGPFYTTRVWDPDAKDIIGPGNIEVEIDRYTTNHAQIIFQDPDVNNSKTFVSMRSKIANIESGTAIFLSVDRRQERGNISYLVDVQTIGKEKTHSSRFSTFSLAMAYRTKFSQRVTSVPTMQWSSYLTDFLEFVGLFTGICVFTLIVAPAHTIAS